MVDPLSMTSLGITICQGLIYACGAWKGFDNDISNSCRAVEDLARTLEVLQNHLRTSYLMDADVGDLARTLEVPQNHLRTSCLMDADVDSVLKCIEGCNAGLRSLDGTLETIEGVHIPLLDRRTEPG